MKKLTLKKCELGWIDISFWNDWTPGVVPLTSGARRAYEKKLAAHIIHKRYTPLVELGITIRVAFREYDDNDGADISVYGRFTAESAEEFAKKARSCIQFVPDSHAFDVFYGDMCLTEDDFDSAGIIKPEVLTKLRAVDVRVRKPKS